MPWAGVRVRLEHVAVRLMRRDTEVCVGQTQAPQVQYRRFGESRMLAAGDPGQGTQVVNDMLEVGDQGPFTIGSATTQMIIGGCYGPLSVQRSRHMALAAPYSP